MKYVYIYIFVCFHAISLESVLFELLFSNASDFSHSFPREITCAGPSMQKKGSWQLEPLLSWDVHSEFHWHWSLGCTSVQGIHQDGTHSVVQAKTCKQKQQPATSRRKKWKQNQKKKSHIQTHLYPESSRPQWQCLIWISVEISLAEAKRYVECQACSFFEMWKYLIGGLALRGPTPALFQW